MPASRWNENLFDILSWIEEENALEELLNLRPITPQVIEQSGDEQEVTEKENGGSGQIPAELPVLPLRGVVVYPQTAVPLTIGQPRSIRLVDDVMAGGAGPRG